MKKFLTWFLGPGGALIAMGLISEARLIGFVWHRLADLILARDLWVEAGGNMPALVNIVSAWWFSPALIAVGFLYTFARWTVDKNQHGRAYGVWIDRAGWVAVISIGVLVVSTVIFDGFLTASGAPELARYIIDQKTDRMMNGEQLQKIIETFRPVAGEIPDLSVQAVRAAPDAAGYAQKFMIALHLAGLTINGIKPENNSEMLYPAPATVSSPQMKGLYIGVKAGAVPPETAIKFKKLLSDAGFKSSFAPWQGVAPNNFVFVVSYK